MENCDIKKKCGIEWVVRIFNICFVLCLWE